MRAILRLDAYPPEIEGVDPAKQFMIMQQQLTRYLEEHYSDWTPVVTVAAGCLDSEEDARRLMRQAWIVYES